MKRLTSTAKVVSDPHVAITITMPLSEWQRMEAQLNGHAYPLWKIRDVIHDAVSSMAQQIDKEYTDEHP